MADMKRHLLEYSQGLLQRTFFPLEGEEITIGRSPKNSIRLPESDVSRAHAVMFFRDGQWLIRDLDSGNGTFVNRRRVKETPVREGDEVQIGKTILRLVEVEEPATPTSLSETQMDAFSDLPQETQGQMNALSHFPEEIQEQMELVNTFLDALPVGAAIINEKMEARYYNEAVQAFFSPGLNEDRPHLGMLLGCAAVEKKSLRCGEFPECMECPLCVATQKAFSGGVPTADKEIPWFVRDGIPSRYVRFSVFPLPYQLTGEPLAQLTWEDITVRTVAQQELQKAREGLERAVEKRTAQLKEANENLKHVEEELRKTNELLEQRVRERTKALSKANETLQAEVVERKRTEEQLLRAKMIAEAASAARSEFLSNMSHELRTPLNHIIGFTELIVDRKIGELNEAQEEYLNDVLTSGRHLLSLISDILDFSGVETGEIGLNHTEVYLKPLLENSLKMVRQKAMKHGLELIQDINGIPDSVQADERKLKQIIYNLLSNAVKFTPDGGAVTLSAKLRSGDTSSERPDGSDGRFVEISVSDTGIGIKPEDQGRIFAAFEQADGSASRKYEGTGLGLALTKTLVELHGGKIRVDSDGEGKGSKFSFTIPISSILVVPEDPLAIRELQTES